MRDSLRFLWAVWDHSKPILTGGALMAIFFLVQVAWPHHAIPGFLYWVVAIIAITMAFFRAWRDQKILADKLAVDLDYFKRITEFKFQIEKMRLMLNGDMANDATKFYEETTQTLPVIINPMLEVVKDKAGLQSLLKEYQGLKKGEGNLSEFEFIAVVMEARRTGGSLNEQLTGLIIDYLDRFEKFAPVI